VSKLTDSIVLNNTYYKVIIVPHQGEEVGDLIGVYNKLSN